MAISDDFTIDYINKTIKHTSGSTIYSTNALYTYIQDTFDELSQMDDKVPMSAQTPSQYTIINNWFISPDSTQYLDSGSLQTSGYANQIHMVTFQSGGYVSAVAGDIGKVVNDDAADFGTLIHYDNTLRKWWIRTGSATTMASGSVVDIDDSGTGAGTTDAISLTGEDKFPNIYSLGSIEAGSSIYIEQNDSKLTSWWSTGHIDILIQSQDSGVEVDGANITIFIREYGDLFDHFDIDLSAGGRQAIPLASATDLNNTTAAATIEDYQNGVTASVAITYGTYSADVNNDTVYESYEAQLDCNSQDLDNVYEVCKWWTQGTSSKDLDGTSGNLYVSVDPGNYTAVKASPLGTFAGGKFFGARGVLVINPAAADAQNYQLIDSDNNTIDPPNVQSFIVNGLEAGDSVTVFKTSGTTVDKSQYNSHATLNESGDADFVIGTTIPNDTPSLSSIVVNAIDEKEEHIYRYASWTGGTISFPTAISSAATGGDTTTLIDTGQTFESSTVEVGDIILDTTNGEYAYVVTVDSDTQLTMTSKATSWDSVNYTTHNLVQAYDGSDTAYIPYIYKVADSAEESVSVVYGEDRTILTRVRKKGIKPFEVQGTFTSTGYSVTAIRTTDTIVS